MILKAQIIPDAILLFFLQFPTNFRVSLWWCDFDDFFRNFFQIFFHLTTSNSCTGRSVKKYTISKSLENTCFVSLGAQYDHLDQIFNVSILGFFFDFLPLPKMAILTCFLVQKLDLDFHQTFVLFRPAT
jgi:hypothetical protein